MKKTSEHYMNLPYTIIVKKDEDGDFVARIQELPGCASHGKSKSEAMANLDEAQELWISDCLEAGDVVPEPEVDELPSGKWVQRVPRSLHKRLAELSKREGVSLNHFVTSLISEALGHRITLPTRISGSESADKIYRDWAIPLKITWNMSQSFPSLHSSNRYIFCKSLIEKNTKETLPTEVRNVFKAYIANYARWR